jgi:hypothetical protein
MNALTLNDRWKMFCMRKMIRAKDRCRKSKIGIVRLIALALALEINDLDKRYFKKRLSLTCIPYNIIPTVSGNGTGKGQQLFYYTFCMLAQSDMPEGIRASDFPPEWYRLLRGPGSKASDGTKSELWHIQGMNFGDLQDCYLVNTVDAQGEQIAIFVTMSELDKRVGGGPLECGDFVRVSSGPAGPPRYEVADTIELDEYCPAMAKWLEDPDTAAALREYLEKPETA